MIVISSIETKRLTLRAPLESHLPSMNDCLSKGHMSFIGGPFDDVGTWRALLASLDHWHMRGFGFWHIEHRKSGKMARVMSIIYHFDWPETELGWDAHHDFEGKGVAYEAAFTAQPYRETHLNISGVIRFIDPANTRSAALAKRLGATFEKTHFLREYECHAYNHLLGDPPKKVTQLEMNQ